MTDLEKIGLVGLGQVYPNLRPPQLYAEILRRGEALVSQEGAVVAETGTYRGRSPNDKFIVREPSSETDVWWGDVNRAFDGNFDALFANIAA